MIDVVLPCLNELQALPWVLGRMPEQYRPIVVDNGSTDGSGALARALGATVIDEPVPGFGSACFAGLRSADSEVVAFMDCDGSLDPRQLGRVTEPVVSGDSDLVLGARAARAGAWPLHARLANRELARRVRRATGYPLRDLGPMRAARRDALLALNVLDRRSGWPLEMVLRAADGHWRVQEVVVDYLPRAGRSKVTGTVRGTVGAVRDMRRALRAHAAAADQSGGGAPGPPTGHSAG